MLGFRFVKTQPTQYVIQYRNGRPSREGAGLAFWYFAPSASIVVVPTASVNEPFIFPEVTADFQEVTIQGQITFRVADPHRTAKLLNFTLDSKGGYISEDPQKLSQRLIGQVQVAMRAEVQALTLKEVLASGQALVGRVAEQLQTHPTVEALGLELLGLSLLAVKPKLETAKALEAEAREALLRRADEAVYSRRNAAVEQERMIKENELATEIAVENKKRQVREAQMDAERSVQERRLQMEREQMSGRIELEEQNKALVALASLNSREEAETKAANVAAMMRSFGGSDPKILQVLASVGMDAGQLMALAFGDFADNAAKIGQLNVSPDLLREMIRPEASR
ncbi:SPFH domain-containing protein [Tardiphaga sp. vice352]|uniref:SPFH domain-containing protein n=1 Tax=unclassified Tardiphaga TaxID=2631404 RepID=UPI001161D964|nr:MULTISPECIES: SPFH domain-containing protein [unclassified Tardiphaga]MBC7583278.1 SPFH domain-containing protein [Tardiphaga sp.]QDM18327.1 SPFH domain-containing protein [Tardiphaga sp. vice278]QDM23331.1 SPFH domain-containing protein [Tardiphaga sp. vice154]QDM28552.1 SPFH domain-containing protein [Tardiphaga sp. vice304]QDM33651.1 SPFH domain-containing protein [Tardiphaga sp. vice352]